MTFHCRATHEELQELISTIHKVKPPQLNRGTNGKRQSQAPPALQGVNIQFIDGLHTNVTMIGESDAMNQGVRIIVVPLSVSQETRIFVTEGIFQGQSEAVGLKLTPPAEMALRLILKWIDTRLDARHGVVVPMTHTETALRVLAEAWDLQGIDHSLKENSPAA